MRGIAHAFWGKNNGANKNYIDQQIFSNETDYKITVSQWVALVGTLYVADGSPGGRPGGDLHGHHISTAAGDIEKLNKRTAPWEPRQVSEFKGRTCIFFPDAHCLVGILILIGLQICLSSIFVTIESYTPWGSHSNIYNPMTHVFSEVTVFGMGGRFWEAGKLGAHFWNYGYGLLDFEHNKEFFKAADMRSLKEYAKYNGDGALRDFIDFWTGQRIAPEMRSDVIDALLDLRKDFINTPNGNIRNLYHETTEMITGTQDMADLKLMKKVVIDAYIDKSATTARIVNGLRGSLRRYIERVFGVDWANAIMSIRKAFSSTPATLVSTSIAGLIRDDMARAEIIDSTIALSIISAIFPVIVLGSAVQRKRSCSQTSLDRAADVMKYSTLGLMAASNLAIALSEANIQSKEDVNVKAGRIACVNSFQILWISSGDYLLRWRGYGKNVLNLSPMQVYALAAHSFVNVLYVESGLTGLASISSLLPIAAKLFEFTKDKLMAPPASPAIQRAVENEGLPPNPEFAAVMDGFKPKTL
jgi:hypothetical protein